MKIDTILYKGLINKDLRVSYIYSYDRDGQYQTIKQKPSGRYSLFQSFSIDISEGFEKPDVFVPANRYYQFTQLLSSTVKKISENLYDLFPNIGQPEFDIDSRTLERFQTEQALMSGGMTMMPAVYADESNTTHAGIRISSSIGNKSMTLPFEDAIPISKMFETFDPQVFGLSMLKIFGRM